MDCPEPQVDKELSEKREKPSTSAFQHFGDYMHAKVSKLDEQNSELIAVVEDDIFANVCIFVTGHTSPSFQELRSIIVKYGGKFCHYFTRSQVTHVIASNLSASRSRDLQNIPVVKPEWITESIKLRQLLPWQKYQLSHRFSDFANAPQEQVEMKRFTSPSSKTISNSPGFVSNYYSSSRLHHLSKWKQELQQKYTFRSRPVMVNNEASIIMHIDMDCFFASVSLLNRPDLVHMPVGISHGQGSGTQKSSDVASCNYKAREYGVKNGMLVGKAKELCPDIIFIPYEFEKYREVSYAIYDTLVQYADALEAVSCDEAYLDVSHSFVDNNNLKYINKRISIDKLTMDDKHRCSAVEYAWMIARKVWETTGLKCSIGIGSNPLIARISTKLAKPGGIFHLYGQQNVQREIDKLSVDSLPGVGWSIRKKLSDNIREKRRSYYEIIEQDDDDNREEEEEKKLKAGTVRTMLSLSELQKLLGQKTGQSLFNALHGMSGKIVASEDVVNAKRQSISVEVNWGIRFTQPDEVNLFLMNLWNELMDRFDKVKSDGQVVTPRKVTINIAFRHEDAPEINPYKYLGCGHCERISRSHKLTIFHADEILKLLGDLLWKCCREVMLKRYPPTDSDKQMKIIKDLRGLGIQLSDLEYESKGKERLVEGRKDVRMNYKMLKQAIIKEYGGGSKRPRVEPVDLTPKFNQSPNVQRNNDEILEFLMQLVNKHCFNEYQKEFERVQDPLVRQVANEYLQRELEW